MSLSLSLVLSPTSQPRPRTSQWQNHEPVGCVDVDGMVIQAGRPCDLANLGKALLDAAEKLAAAQVNWAAAQEAPHAWKPSESSVSDLCDAMIMRNGDGDTCGLPRAHTCHALPLTVGAETPGAVRA